MPRKLSHIAPDWWDYTTLDSSLINDAAKLTERDLRQLSRPGFKVVMYDTLEDFYLAEALEYIAAWKTKKEVPVTHALSFERADRELCFNRIQKKLVMPEANLHFPTAKIADFVQTWHAGVRCAVMQGGQGDIKHWAFNDPLKRTGKYKDAPPSPAEYRKLGTRIVELHPITLSQNARTSGGGNITMVPKMAITVGPQETWLADKVSIWHAGAHDNPLGQRLTALMISKQIADSAVPMSLLADHPNVQFNYFRGGLGSCSVEMH